MTEDRAKSTCEVSSDLDFDCVRFRGRQRGLANTALYVRPTMQLEGQTLRNALQAGTNHVCRLEPRLREPAFLHKHGLHPETVAQQKTFSERDFSN